MQVLASCSDQRMGPSPNPRKLLPGDCVIDLVCLCLSHWEGTRVVAVLSYVARVVAVAGRLFPSFNER